ncbi:hypothetical protein Tsubulata_021967 [Turnera subulata]|uniref:Dirigent protein n=1 Tax=Turnera subulata TaxID=218843 RepID=A0A9Q0FL98_9ROSI|nr:hypothetical protein Tsubulata_021967 [Turnera subulata]
MAKTLNHLASTFLFVSIITSPSFVVAATATTESDHHFARHVSPATLGLKREKLSHLRFYFHDIVSGKNPTAIKVVQPPDGSATGFGMVAMIDDPLTLTPDLNSTLVGRAQGLYANAAQGEDSLLMAFNFAFLEGKYNGSSLSVLGRNYVSLTVREMPIVGGSGIFRFARGYSLARTLMFNFTTGDAVVEYNVYVFHY